MLILQLIGLQKTPSLLLLHHPRQLTIPNHLDTVYFAQVLKLGIEIESVMLHDLLLIVLLGLRFQRFGDGDDPVEVMTAHFELVLLEIFVFGHRPALIVLEPSLIFFLSVVVCEMDAG